jgi:hypothetical protein
MSIMKIRNTARTVQASVQYVRGHWIVVIRNAGQSHWTPVLDHSKQVPEHDIFGEVVRNRPAVMTFEDMKEAETWIKNAIPTAADAEKAIPLKGTIRFSAFSAENDLQEALQSA